MAHFSLVIFACIAAAAHALVLQGGSIYQPSLITKEVEQIDVRPQYTFSYEVKDPKTGDIKNQVESRDGDVVKGSYSLLDADGLIRTVQYSSDKLNGFNALVSRTPSGKQIVAAPAVIKSIPVLQQPSYIGSGSSILQGPSLIQTQGYGIQSPQLTLGSGLSGAYSSSNLIRSPPSLGLSISGIKSSPLVY